MLRIYDDDDTGIIDVYDNNTANIRINGADGIGIGLLDGAPDPQSALHIERTATTLGFAREMIRLEVKDNDNVDMTSGEGPAIVFFVGEDDGDDISDPGGQLAVVRESTTDANSAAKMSFWTAANDASLVEQMSISSGGELFFYNIDSATGDRYVAWDTSTNEVTYRTSTRKAKNNISSHTLGLDVIEKLNPVEVYLQMGY